MKILVDILPYGGGCPFADSCPCRMDKDEWEYYEAEFLYGKVEPIKMQREQISNEKMLELYNEGGIEAVWEGMDADEIYRSESDAADLGIIKRR